MNVQDEFARRAEKCHEFWRLLIDLPCGRAISLMAGEGLYCTPRQDSDAASTYSEVEAVLFGEGSSILSPQDLPNLPDEVRDTFQQATLAYAPWDVIQRLYDYLT